MSDLTDVWTPPGITIVLTTWLPKSAAGLQRYGVVKQTVRSWLKHLIYEGEIALHVADDGSTMDNYAGSIDDVPATWWPDRHLVTFSRQINRGVGASLNEGMRASFNRGWPVVLYAVDDWMLEQDLDVTPWVRLLMSDPTLCAVRLGMPHPGISGTVEMNPWGWHLRLDRHNFAFGHRPALYHSRMIDAYGWFPKDVSPLECERLYNDKHCRLEHEPSVALALLQPWRHVDSFSSSGIAPEDRA